MVTQKMTYLIATGKSGKKYEKNWEGVELMVFLLTVLMACIFDKDLSIWIYLLSFLIDMEIINYIWERR